MPSKRWHVSPCCPLRPYRPRWPQGRNSAHSLPKGSNPRHKHRFRHLKICSKIILFGFPFQRRFNSKLSMSDTRSLLADYVKNGSEAAFRELVARYINLVYCTALRLVGNDTQLAQDVAQTVFI